MAYARLEPFGERYDDVRLARWMSMYANANSKKGKSHSADEFMPDYSPSKDTDPDVLSDQLSFLEQEIQSMSGDED